MLAKIILLGVVLSSIALHAATAEAPNTGSPEAIYGLNNFGWTDRPQVARGDWPSNDSLYQLYSNGGFRVVINITPSSENPELYDAEVSQAAILGMEFINIPAPDN